MFALRPPAAGASETAPDELSHEGLSDGELRLATCVASWPEVGSHTRHTQNISGVSLAGFRPRKNTHKVSKGVAATSEERSVCLVFCRRRHLCFDGRREERPRRFPPRVKPRSKEETISLSLSLVTRGRAVEYVWLAVSGMHASLRRPALGASAFPTEGVCFLF